MARNINPQNFVLAQNAAMWVHPATSNAMKIIGLQGLGLAMGFSQTEKEVPMMGVRVSPVVFTGAKYDSMSIKANFIPGDATQAYMKNAAETGTMVKPVRLYVKDGCHFSAPDQPNAGGGYTSGTSGLNIGNWTDPQAGSPSDFFTNSISTAPGGPFVLFIAHTVKDDYANITVRAQTTTGAGAEIELIDNTIWDTLGFDDGDTILVDYNGSTPKYARIASGVGTDTLILEEDVGDAAALIDGLLTIGSDGFNGAVHGATPSAVTGMDLSC